jgi:Bacterial PH domain/Short C-terminal domain
MAYIDDMLGRGEKIIYQGHQHWMVLVGNAIKWIGGFVLALIGAIVLSALQPEADSFLVTAKTVVLWGLVGIMVICLFAFFWHFLIWITERYYLTNERIIQVEGIINKNTSDSSLDKINDIQVEQSVLGRIWGYANLAIQTGNENPNVFRMMSKPFDFKKMMIDAKNGYYGDAGPGKHAEHDQAPRPQVPARPQQPNFDSPVPQPAQYRQPTPQNQYQPQPRPGYAPYDEGNVSAPNPQDIPAMIAQLAKLRDSGVISEAEFQQKKNDLLRRM